MRKFGRILFCFIPFIAAYAIQFLVSIPVAGIVYTKALLDLPSHSSFLELTMNVQELLLSQEVTGTISLLYSLSVVILFGFWYQKRFRALDVKTIPTHFNPWILVGIVLLVPGLQYLTSYVATFTAAINPQWLENYEALIETAGLTDVSLLMGLYAVLIGPICEELIFRGITLSYAEKDMPFWVANLFQAILFGVYHLNMIQGVYAAFIGLFFGYIYRKTKSIFPCMLMHILFNGFGLFVPENFMYKADIVLFFFIWLIVGIILTVLGMLLVRKGALNKFRTKQNHITQPHYYEGTE